VNTSSVCRLNEQASDIDANVPSERRLAALRTEPHMVEGFQPADSKS
jgi:hypothetical protein